MKRSRTNHSIRRAASAGKFSGSAFAAGHSARSLTLAVMTALIATVTCGAAFAAADAGFAKGRILVEPLAGLSPADFAAVLKPHGGRARKIGQSNLHIVDLPANASEPGIVEKLSRNPHIKFVELDRKVKSAAVANDPYFGSEWHLATVGATTAWNTTSGAGTTIAILDSGVDGTHPDLVPNLVPGFNFVDSNTNTNDVCGHGTAVAGTAAASANNGIGVAGVAGAAKIMPLRIAFIDTTGACSAYVSTIASAITYAADHGARIANVSYGGVTGSASVQSAGNYLKGKGGLLFVSAGNNGVNDATVPTTSMITVSATNSSDTITSWSTFGNFVAVSAPGDGIWTTSRGGSYGGWSGTSFSSPLAAGVGALVLAANPGLSATAAENILYTTAVDLGTAGRDIYYGYGRVDAAAAVQSAVNSIVAVDSIAPVAGITSPPASSTATGLVNVNVAASDNVGVARVELKVNGTTVATDTSAPFVFSWDSAGVTNGMANLVATAYDAAGNVGNSATVSVNVANTVLAKVADTTPPSVKVTNPAAGWVNGNVNVTTSASDNMGAAGIVETLYIDGVLKAQGTGGALSYTWNTRKAASGTHTIQVIAKDAAGNSSTSSVQVNN